MANYYELLGLNQDASTEEIEAKLKDRKRIWTQRQNAPKPEQQQEASNNLRMVPDIEANLLDPEKRSAYDQELRTAPQEKTSVDASKIEADDLIKEGLRLLSVGNIPDALMVATRATEIQGDNPDAWALLGYTHAKWGEIDKAIYEYDRAINIRPNDASFYYDLGSIYEEVEKWQDAMKQYERAAKIDPKTTVYRASMGSVFIKNEIYSRGIEILEQCNKEEPNNEGYKYLLALAYNDSVMDQWISISDGRYLSCTEEMTNTGIELFEKGLALNIDDEEMRTMLEGNLEGAKWASEKHWGYNIEGSIKGFAGAFFGGLVAGAILSMVGPEFIGSILAGISILGIPALWIKSGFKPGWKINANAYKENTGEEV